MRKFLHIFVLFLIAFLFFSTDTFGVSTTAGYSHSSITPIVGPNLGVDAKARLDVSGLAVNVGETVGVDLVAQYATPSFVLRSNAHNRQAKYKYKDTINPVIFSNENMFEKYHVNIHTTEEKDYVLGGRLTFRWDTGIGKVSEGFPKYCYMTVNTDKKILQITDLDKIIESDEESENDGLDQAPKIQGSVLHTTTWEQRRKKLLRDENVFWAGEKFLLVADLKAEKRPEFIKVTIENTKFSTYLWKDGTVWRGSLFDKKMLGMWGGRKLVPLTFNFKAIFQDGSCSDNVQVNIEDEERYWNLHRKE